MDSRQRRRPVVGCRLEGEQHDQALLHGLPIRSEAQGSPLVASGEDRLTRGLPLATRRRVAFAPAHPFHVARMHRFAGRFPCYGRLPNGRTSPARRFMISIAVDKRTAGPGEEPYQCDRQDPGNVFSSHHEPFFPNRERSRKNCSGAHRHCSECAVPWPASTTSSPIIPPSVWPGIVQSTG